MAQIDITELLTDPDFVDEIKIVRRSSIVNTRGENMVKETVSDSVGSVQPTDGKTLKRLPQSLQQENLSSFWIKGDIRTTKGCDYPTVLVFKGSRYQVKAIFNWTNWGQGWCEGVCVEEPLT